MIGASFDAVLASASGGDEHAFAILWRDLQPALLRYLRVIAPAACEDLASETWLEVARGLSRFQGNEVGFRSWVFTVARHRTVDWRRREARHPSIPLPPEEVPERPGPSDAADPVLEAISTRAALALIAELPPDQAEVVTLRVVAGLDVAQVAEIVGKRAGAVRVLAHRGLRRLAERLGADLPASRRVGERNDRRRRSARRDAPSTTANGLPVRPPGPRRGHGRATARRRAGPCRRAPCVHAYGNGPRGDRRPAQLGRAGGRGGGGCHPRARGALVPPSSSPSEANRVHESSQRQDGRRGGDRRAVRGRRRWRRH